MGVYKRGETWWYRFNWNGETIRESTKQSNKRVAEQIESARRTGLAKGEVGIKDRAAVPTLAGFKARFMEAIEVRCATKPNTIEFYRGKLGRLLEYSPLASARLDEIDEALIEGYVQERRKTVAPGTVNRQLATLRRALRLAQEWKILNRVPRIRLLPGEHIRDFVLTHDQEKAYLALAPQPLLDFAALMVDTGLRVGEATSLEWRDVHLEPAAGARFGYLTVREGKSRYAKRNVSLTGRLRRVLETRAASAAGLLVFTTVGGGPYLGTYLNRLHQRVRELLKLPKDFVLHSFRHTMLTRLGEAGVDTFTIMRIAGHSSIIVSQRYVHPSPEAMERAIERLEAANGRGEARGRHNLSTMPDSAELRGDVKSLQ